MNTPLPSVSTQGCLFFSCLYSKRGVYDLWMLPISLERGPQSTYWTRHTGPHFWLLCLLTQLLSCWNDPIPGVVNMSTHTYLLAQKNHMETHIKFPFKCHWALLRHSLILAWWNKGALALCCCLIYGSYGGFLAISCCWDPQNRSYLNLCRPHPRCTTLCQWIGAWDFLNHVFLLFGQLYFSSFFLFFYDVQSSGYCTALWQGCVGPEWWRKAENREWESK